MFLHAAVTISASDISPAGVTRSRTRTDATADQIATARTARPIGLRFNHSPATFGCPQLLLSCPAPASDAVAAEVDDFQRAANREEFRDRFGSIIPMPLTEKQRTHDRVASGREVTARQPSTPKLCLQRSSRPSAAAPRGNARPARGSRAALRATASSPAGTNEGPLIGQRSSVRFSSDHHGKGVILENTPASWPAGFADAARDRIVHAPCRR